MIDVKSDTILSVKDLKIHFDTEEGEVKAIENVSYELKTNEVLGIVGETGSGKSVSAYAIMGLIPHPPGKILKGEILFRGRDLLKMKKDEIRKIRGNDIAMIFQEPMTSLNPVFTIGEQMIDILKAHGFSKKEAKIKSMQALKKVRMPDPELVLKKYPHELSGGMRQRVMIAMALSCEPTLLIADEPTTALDVTVQAQVLKLLKQMQQDYNLSVLLITHNLGVVAQNCDSIAVMYAGNIVEYGSADQIFENALHPYTKGLLRAIPPLESETESLNVIPGSVPNLLFPPSGCRFHPRCEKALKGKCDVEIPTLKEVKSDPGHKVACFNPYGGNER